MLDPKLVRQSTDTVAAQLKTRGFMFAVEKFHQMEELRKGLQIKMQELQNERNVKSKEVGFAKAKGQDVGAVLEHLKVLSAALKTVEEQFSAQQEALDVFFASLPNLPHQSVPIGKDETSNQEIRRVGKPREFHFTPKDHVELCAPHGLIDFETAAKIAGSRFAVLRGPVALMQRALINFMLDMHIKDHGYQEIFVPYIVNADACFGTSQLSSMKDDLFSLQGENERYLIPTAEIPVTNTVRDQIVEGADLPLKYVCYSSCFRSEAGSYGKDIRGMLRQHQFEKVELVQIVKPEQSYHALEELTQHAEAVLKRLGLPYRTMALCTGDLGFASAKTYDLEVWLPGQQCYREISSCSNMESFQARRMKARFRDELGNVELLHSLNGSALAVGRTLIAIVENYQDELGRIHVPEALQPYMDGLNIIE